MKLAIAGDEAGAPLARALALHLGGRLGLEVSELSDPPGGVGELYADLGDRVAGQVAAGAFDRAILCCGTGIGVAIAANKVPGIRAAQTHDTYSAERAALSNDAHIITMGARVVGVELAKAIADAWLAQAGRFDPQGRSAPNVAAIEAVEERHRR
jgi:ribose 5-phosphate isomerase B